MNIDDLKKRVGKSAFTTRLKFSGDFAKCPFHEGTSEQSLHVKQQQDGAYTATCFSDCNKSWDAISFVEAMDRCTFQEAVYRLGGDPQQEQQQATPLSQPEKPTKKATAMTPELWAKWGKPITQKDRDRFAASRPHSATATLAWYLQHDCRVKGDLIGIPYWFTRADGSLDCFTVKTRHVDEKKIFNENNITQRGLFNLDTVNLLTDCYVLEGELTDVGVLEDAGFCAVSVTTGSQKEFEPEAIKKLSEASRIFLVGDQNDPAGEACMDTLHKVLPAAKTYRIRFTGTKVKDVGELALELGDGLAKRIEELTADSLITWVEKNIPKLGQLSDRPLHWIVDRFLPEHCVTQISAKQGSQKSMLALYLAHSIATGNPALGRRTQKRPVVYVDRENPEAIVSERRNKFDFDLEVGIHYWGDWLPDSPPEPDDPRLLEFAARLNAVVVFDSLQQFYGELKSEIDNVGLTKLMRKFTKLARQCAGVIILHHAAYALDDAGKPKSRGGTAGPANTEMAILAQKDEDGIVHLTEDRFRCCGSWELDFQINFDHHPYFINVVRDQDMTEIVQARNERKAEKADEVNQNRMQLVALVKADPSLSARTLSAKTGVDCRAVSKLLNQAKWAQIGPNNKSLVWTYVGDEKAEDLQGRLIQ